MFEGKWLGTFFLLSHIQKCSETSQECHGNLVFLQSNHVASCGIFRDHRPSRQDKAIIYVSSQEPNKDFAQKLVQTFNWILLTAAETRQLREELLEESQCHPQLLQLASLPSTGTGAKEVKPLFLELLEPWFHNPASALALCLLACTWLKRHFNDFLRRIHRFGSLSSRVSHP